MSPAVINAQNSALRGSFIEMSLSPYFSKEKKEKKNWLATYTTLQNRGWIEMYGCDVRHEDIDN
jgi:hypothetical protein